MNPIELKAWILVLSASFTLISAGISSWLALKQYRLKLKAEERLAKSSKVEVDIRLIKAFTELMDIAHARAGNILSEKVIENLFMKDVFTAEDFKNLGLLNQKIKDSSVIVLPVGAAAQDAAIAAIATLANRHDVLKEAAIQALESIKGFKPEIAEKYLKKIQKEQLSAASNKALDRSAGS